MVSIWEPLSTLLQLLLLPVSRLSSPPHLLQLLLPVSPYLCCRCQGGNSQGSLQLRDLGAVQYGSTCHMAEVMGYVVQQGPCSVAGAMQHSVQGWGLWHDTARGCLHGAIWHGVEGRWEEGVGIWLIWQVASRPVAPSHLRSWTPLI